MSKLLDLNPTGIKPPRKICDLKFVQEGQDNFLVYHNGKKIGGIVAIGYSSPHYVAILRSTKPIVQHFPTLENARTFIINTMVVTCENCA